jgi:hypothetical protein
MVEQESVAVRKANRLFRKKEQEKEGATAWKEYIEREQATRLKTARLRAQRLARDAAAASTAAAVRRRVGKASLAKR